MTHLPFRIVLEPDRRPPDSDAPYHETSERFLARLDGPPYHIETPIDSRADLFRVAWQLVRLGFRRNWTGLVVPPPPTLYQRMRAYHNLMGQ